MIKLPYKKTNWILPLKKIYFLIQNSYMKSSLEILDKGEFGEDWMVENGMGMIEVVKEDGENKFE